MVITLNGGYKYEVVIIDSTHVKFKSDQSKQWGIPQHINQVCDDILSELKKQGVVKGSFFITE